uniref:Uncharacterized protein n=1 Tax=Arundo donax TaxID=35708 RepID=A0A0A8YJJ2_ARUDO
MVCLRSGVMLWREGHSIRTSGGSCSTSSRGDKD